MAKKSTPPTEPVQEDAAQDYTQPTVPLDVIEVKEGFNPRTELGDLTQLVENIKEHGIIEPLVVCPNADGSGLYVVCGHRRLAAAKEAGLTEVPIHLMPSLTIEDEKALQIAASENSGGKDGARLELSDLDQAALFNRMQELGNNVTSIAKLSGYSRTYVHTTMRLNEIPEEVRAKVRSGDLGKRAAVAIMEIPEEVREKFIAENLSPGTTEVDVHKFANAARRALKDKAVPTVTDSEEHVIVPSKRNTPLGNLPGQISTPRSQTEVRAKVEVVAKVLFDAEIKKNEQAAFAHAWALAGLLWQCGVIEEVDTDTPEFEAALASLKKRLAVTTEEDEEDAPAPKIAPKKKAPVAIVADEDEEEDVRPKKPVKAAKVKAKKQAVDADDDE